MSHRTSSTPGAPIELESSTKASAHIRIRMQQAYQPEAASPPSMVRARRRLIEMHRLGVEFGGERDHLLARQAARAVLEDAARREVFPSGTEARAPLSAEAPCR